jgi:hypothetical protein
MQNAKHVLQKPEFHTDWQLQTTPVGGEKYQLAEANPMVSDKEQKSKDILHRAQ